MFTPANIFFGSKKRYQRLVDSSTEMFVTAVNMQTGEVVYGNQHHDTKPVLLQKILASASVPVMMPPVKVGKYQYVDGGVKDIAPFSKAIDEGATHIVSVILSPDASHREPKQKEYTSSMDILKRSLELLTEEIVDSDVKIATVYSEGIRYLDLIKANAKDKLGLTDPQIKRLFTGMESPFEGKGIVGITVIRPDEELMPESLSFDPEKMREMVDKGYKKAKQVVSQEIARGPGFFDPV